MESKEVEVHSDDGSYELVNLDDYASESEHLNMGPSDDDGSYELVCSELSDTLVLTENEAFLTESVHMDVKSETDSDHTEEGELGLKIDDDSDHTEGVNAFSRANKGKKRDLMTMLYEGSNANLYDFPTQFKLKNDIKEVAKDHIIRYLPAKSLFKCRQVSQEWNNWISSPFFAHLQSQYFRKTSGFFLNSDAVGIRFISLENSAYGVPYPSLRFLPRLVSIKSSCNGLLLCQALYADDNNLLYICNPANKEWVKIPTSSSYHGVHPKFVLAFEPSSLNFEPRYQVICLYSLPYPDMGPVLCFDIYDSETKFWSGSNVICPDLDPSNIKSDGVFVNGVVYWETRGGELLAYDLKNDIYSVQMLPSDEGGALTNIHGEICYVRARYDHAMKLCMLDVYGDVVMSLKKTIIIFVDDIEDGAFVECQVLGSASDNEVAFVVTLSQGQKHLYVYDVKAAKVQGPVFFDYCEKLFPYVNSLVSIGA